MIGYRVVDDVVFMGGCIFWSSCQKSEIKCEQESLSATQTAISFALSNYQNEFKKHVNQNSFVDFELLIWIVSPIFVCY
jgi:hypothetical protein